MFDTLTTEEFDEWLDELPDAVAREAIAARIIRLQSGSFGDSKMLGGGLGELRVHYGPGYRVYFTQQGRAVIVLLCGGDKSEQRRDIRRARRMLDDL